MPGPAHAGLFIYAKDRARLAAFYASVLGMARIRERDDLVVLESRGLQLLVHGMPREVADSIEIASPPVRRDGTAVKFFFTVPSLALAEAAITQLGGVVYPEEWTGPGFVVRNACDPEGNVFHLREATA